MADNVIDEQPATLDVELMDLASRLFDAARGADVDRHNNRGQTPLAGAVFKNDATVIELLLSADADPLAGSPSALETARYFQRDELAWQLVQLVERRGVN
jgi:ankyrin repeat protein